MFLFRFSPFNLSRGQAHSRHSYEVCTMCTVDATFNDWKAARTPGRPPVDGQDETEDPSHKAEVDLNLE